MAEAWQAWIDGLYDLVAGGGLAMPALFLCAWLMWITLAWRALRVIPGAGHRADGLWERARRGQALSRGVLSEAVGRVVAGLPSLRALSDKERAEWVRTQVEDLRVDVGRHRRLAMSLVTSAPLLGLLGTVSGMIETFDALGQQALFRQSGGIAGGISEALLTTQVGLFIAIPGTLVARMVDRREDAIVRGLDLLESLAQRDGASA